MSRLCALVLLLVFAALALSPIYIMFKISLSPPREVLTPHPSWLLKEVTLEHWKAVLPSPELWRPLIKSIVVATATMALGILLSAPAAYVISRMRPRYRYAFILSLFAARMFPEVGIALPIAITFIRWNLLDTHVGLIMAHLIRTLPFISWILVGTFETIPRSLEQAAQMDGCSRLGTLLRVVFPLAAPGIAVAAIFGWLESWNEFTYALYLTLVENTLPLQTYYYVIRGSWFHSAAYATVLTLPVMAVTFSLQRYLRAGYMAGAVKG